MRNDLPDTPKQDNETTMANELKKLIEPDAYPERQLVSAWLDKNLVSQVNKQRKKQKIRTRELLTGLLKYYLKVSK